MEGEPSVKAAVLQEGGQGVDDQLFAAPPPELFNFFTERGVFWLEETDRVGLVELVGCRFPRTFSGQVEQGLGFGDLLTAPFKPLVYLLVILVSDCL